MEYFISALFCIIIFIYFGVGYYLVSFLKKQKTDSDHSFRMIRDEVKKESSTLDPEVMKSLNLLLNALKEQRKALSELPIRTLNTIQGSVNNVTGKLGEMMQLIELQQLYDRLIVVGDIVDFIGIKFDPPAVDFIDVKSGKRATLSNDQKKLREIILADPTIVSFKVVKTEIINASNS